MQRDQQLLCGFENLPPWDANAYFQLPVETHINGAAGDIPVAQANPMRVGLFFGLASAAGGNVNLSTLGSGAGGFLLNQQAPNKEFWHSLHAVLCQVGWTAIIPVGQQLVVIELILKEWPT